MGMGVGYIPPDTQAPPPPRYIPFWKGPGTWDTLPPREQNDWHAPLKILPSRNFVGGL